MQIYLQNLKFRENIIAKCEKFVKTMRFLAAKNNCSMRTCGILSSDIWRIAIFLNFRIIFVPPVVDFI